MMQDIKEHWIAILQSYFPKNAEIFLHPIQDHFCLDVSWKLNNDPNRPNKRSKKLRLIISQETFEDYLSAGEKPRDGFDQNLTKFMEDKIANFEPDHDTSYWKAPPVETIHVPFGIKY